MNVALNAIKCTQRTGKNDWLDELGHALMAVGTGRKEVGKKLIGGLHL